MYVTQQHLNSVWKSLIDKLKDDEVIVNTYLGGLGRLMSKVDPLVRVNQQLCIEEYDDEIREVKTLTGLPANADYRGPDGCVINIKRKVFNGKEWCTTTVVESGKLDSAYIAYLEKVGIWEFVGTDRWKKKDVFAQTIIEDEVEVVYEEDDDCATDESLETVSSTNFEVYIKTGEKKQRGDGIVYTYYDAIDTVLSAKDNIIRRSVLIPINNVPDQFSEVYVTRDGMKVLVTKHVNIASGEKLKYKKVLNPDAFSSDEIEKIQRTTSW